jgi:hypothetical protein
MANDNTFFHSLLNCVSGDQPGGLHNAGAKAGGWNYVGLMNAKCIQYCN